MPYFGPFIVHQDGLCLWSYLVFSGQQPKQIQLYTCPIEQLDNPLVPFTRWGLKPEAVLDVTFRREKEMETTSCQFLSKSGDLVFFKDYDARSERNRYIYVWNVDTAKFDQAPRIRIYLKRNVPVVSETDLADWDQKIEAAWQLPMPKAVIDNGFTSGDALQDAYARWATNRNANQKLNVHQELLVLAYLKQRWPEKSHKQYQNILVTALNCKYDEVLVNDVSAQQCARQLSTSISEKELQEDLAKADVFYKQGNYVTIKDVYDFIIALFQCALSKAFPTKFRGVSEKANSTCIGGGSIPAEPLLQSAYSLGKQKLSQLKPITQVGPAKQNMGALQGEIAKKVVEKYRQLYADQKPGWWYGSAFSRQFFENPNQPPAFEAIMNHAEGKNTFLFFFSRGTKTRHCVLESLKTVSDEAIKREIQQRLNAS